MTRNEYHSALRHFLPNRYEDVVETPLEPVPPGVYITTKHDLAKFPNAEGRRLFEFLKFFRPTSEIDEALILALALTPFWGGRPGGRPLLVVTGPDGKATELILHQGGLNQTAKKVD